MDVIWNLPAIHRTNYPYLSNFFHVQAMEQQTISVAKAGITTVLNCRASVLAAANPIFGRYDDLKDVGENIDLMTTILSR